MAQVFLSYAREDLDRARALAEALGAAGISVWWDRTIPPGRQFDEVIEEELKAAQCALVLWSKASVQSKWVKTEATEADRRNILIPVLVERDARVPLAFSLLQAADLTAWSGKGDDPAWHEVLAAIRARIGDAGSGMGTGSRTPPERPEEEGAGGTGAGERRGRTPMSRRRKLLLTGVIMATGMAGTCIVNVLDPSLFGGNRGRDAGGAAQPESSIAPAANPAGNGGERARDTTPIINVPVREVAPATRTITGIITDEATGRPVPGAQVQLVGTSITAMTSVNGVFRMTVPGGDTTLLVRYIGYQPTRINVPAGASGVAVRMR